MCQVNGPPNTVPAVSDPGVSVPVNQISRLDRGTTVGKANRQRRTTEERRRWHAAPVGSRERLWVPRDPPTLRSLADDLESAVSRSWDRGWQPADLVRVVSRRLTTEHVSLIRDAIASQLQHYAPATIDPRWTSQLSDLEVRVWWRPDQSHLSAWVEMHNIESSTALSRTLAVINLVNGLPELEKLTPLPGTARLPATMTQPERAAINERVLGRIRLLLAKAESSTFPAEAETFTAGAQSLMARHSIDHALLSALSHSPSDAPTGRRIGIERPYDSPKAMLLGAVARANRCRTVWSRQLGFSTAVGFAADLDAVELLFTSLLVQATTTMMKAGSQTDGYGRTSTRSYRQSFLTGYASRIGQRLAEATGTQTTKASTEPAGQNLLPVLAARSEAVESAVTAMFPSLSKHVMGSVTNSEGWFSGLSAADRAALHHDEELLG
ncbi:MAG: hypothetical protein QOF35_1905 [Actinomycetota bacterium]|nr:hypothetical protein [Actinomycetota bacterium]